MKKTNYLLLVLLVCFNIPLIGQPHVAYDAENEQQVKTEQNLRPDYRANKSALDEMKSVREMIMRSNNPVFKTKALKQVNQQMREMFLGEKSETLHQPVELKENPAKIKSSDRYLLNPKTRLIQSEPTSVLTGKERRKVSFDGVMKYRLDSMVISDKADQDWMPKEKWDFTYNYNAQVTSNAGYEYDASKSAWGNNYKSTITYNEAGQPTMYLDQRWDSGLERWIDRHKEIIEYNAYGDVTLEAAYSEYYDQDSSAYVYRGEWKNEYGFDANNNEVSNINYSWDFENYDWIPDGKFEYNYENGMELMFAGYMWNREKQKWIGHFKFEHEIVPGIDMLGSTYYHWDYEHDVWYIQEKTTYALSTNEFGIVVTETRWYTDKQSGQLVYDMKTVYSNPYGEVGHDLGMSFRSIVNYQWSGQYDIWVDNSKTANTFDTYGNITMRLDSIWRSVNGVYQWLAEFAIEANVNANGKISDYVITRWYYNGHVNSILDKTKFLNTYNEKLELITQTRQVWNFDHQVWVNSTKVEFAYDADGRQISQMMYDSYNFSTEQWNPFRKMEWAFNTDGSQALYASYDWIPPIMKWRLDYKVENYIDSYGEAILESTSKWNGSLGMEIMEYRREKTFDEQRNLTMESDIQSNMYWDGSKYFLDIEGEKIEYVYDTSNRLISLTEYDYEQLVFVPNRKYEYTYNATYPTALDSEIVYEWNDGWVKDKKGVLTSNFDVTRKDLILPFGDDEGSREVAMYFNYMATQFIESIWSEENQSWVEDFKSELFFTQSEFSSVDKINAGSVSVYPNPVSDYLQVRLNENSGVANFKLFDVQGKMLHQVPVHNQLTIDLSKFQNGLYFYQLTTDNETVSGKLLKK